MFNSPMKAITVENGEYHYPCYVSEKYDGWRCLIAEGVMYTSSGTPFKPNVQARFKPIIDAGKEICHDRFTEQNVNLGGG